MISLIYACDLDGNIGRNGGLPWDHIESDMRWFAQNTKGSVLVMGRDTWDTIGKLPGREAVVVTNRECEGADLVVSGDPIDMLEAIKQKYPGRDISIIGGAMIYFQFYYFCDTFFTTVVKDVFEGDTKFDCRAMLHKSCSLQTNIEVPETDNSPGLIFQKWVARVH